MKPIVAIVGRPNVGKSTLFNRIAGARIAIVEDTPGVTRDRIYANAEWLQNVFTLIDTGGIEPQSDDDIMRQMQRQAELAVDTADVIVFLVDGREGYVSADMEVANILRRSRKPVVLAVNKVDSAGVRGQPRLLPACRRILRRYPRAAGPGIGDLPMRWSRIFPRRPPRRKRMGRAHGSCRQAQCRQIVALVNALLKEERTIVSDVPGTTRDAIDTLLTVGGRDGVPYRHGGHIRRKRSIDPKSVERYGVIRALSAACAAATSRRW